MKLGDSTIIQLSKAKMRYLGQRQAVLASNVANADTSGYQAKDIKEPDFKQVLSGVSTGQMVRTHARHMQPAGSNGGFSIAERADMGNRNPDDNRVNIEEEVQQVSFTQNEYNKVISIYRKNVSMYKMALGQGQGG